MAKRKDEEEKINQPGSNGSSGSGAPSGNTPDDNSAKPKDPGTGGGNNPRANTTAHSAAVVAAARLASAYPTGAKTTDKKIATNGTSTVQSTGPVSGILVLDYIPTFGYSADINSALNRASSMAFNRIRSKISGTRPYAPSDHMLYRACVDSLRELYHMVLRLYGIVGKYSATNLYTPRAILYAMGFDAEDIIQNASKIYHWQLTNYCALRPYPTIPMGAISERRIAYSSAIFTDGDLPGSQMYIPNQKVFYSYEVVDQVKGITARTLPANAKWSDIVSLWNTMLSALANSSDVYIMASDITRAYENETITELPTVPEGYVVPIGKTDFALDSIMNTDVLSLGGANDSIGAFGNSIRIYDDKGILKCMPVISKPNYISTGSEEAIYYVPSMLNHINATSQDLDTDGVVRALQNKVVHEVVFTKTSSGPDQATFSLTDKLTSFGFEVYTGARIITLDDRTVPGFIQDDISGGMIFGDYYSSGSFSVLLRILSRLSKFDWHPPVAVYALYDTMPGEFDEVNIFEDLQNYVPVTDENIKQMHDALLLEYFGIA